jgi:hypothetical protein
MGNARQASAPSPADRDDLESVQGHIVFGRRSPGEQAPSVVVPNYEGYPMVAYDVPVRDARPIMDELTLDKEGFVLVQHKSATSAADMDDPEALREKFFDEMIPFIKERFGASWVVPGRAAFRARRAAGQAIPKNGWNTVSGAGVREPAGMAHVDFAPVSAPMSAASVNQVQGIEIRPYSRLMIIQVWRALSPPPQDIPLAFCDASTVVDADIALADYVGHPNEEHKSAIKLNIVRFNPAHRWYYFPNMTADEMILFKGYDSDDHYKRRAPHSAFDNRDKHPNARPRESVEARFYVYYD